MNLTPTVTVDADGTEHRRENAPVLVYDTSGPYGDKDARIDLKKGLPRLREEWIEKRGGVERLSELSSEYGRARLADKSLDHLRFEHIQQPLRAKEGAHVTQMWYAKQGVVTPEMEYVAIRENMNCASSACLPRPTASRWRNLAAWRLGLYTWEVCLPTISRLM